MPERPATRGRLFTGLRRALPGPRGAPWVGVALQLRRAPLRVLLDAAYRFGDVVPLGGWPRRLYLINHPTLIQHILQALSSCWG